MEHLLDTFKGILQQMDAVLRHPMDFYASLMIVVFVIGYAFITFEHWTRINKATVALLMAVVCWLLQFLDTNWTMDSSSGFLGHHLANISQVVFFLLGALTIVEIINVHKGFNIITRYIRFQSLNQLLWLICLLTFFLSAILDNLTTTIVMVSILAKLIKPSESRLLIGGGIVIAANAGGAWTPIGDVTTTMLWIGGQISTLNVMKELFVPSFVCMIVALLVLSFWLRGKPAHTNESSLEAEVEPHGTFIFYLGLGLLMSVPFIKITTGLPPFMAMLLALGILWLVTDILHRDDSEREHLKVQHVLTRIDLASALFFLGILLCIDALDSAQILRRLAVWMDSSIGNPFWIATYIGLASAVVDNVPLVAATQGMYSLAQFPTDHSFWQLIAYCAGTGGSILIVGSAAGVVFMSLEKVDFIWYLKRISLAAALGYFAGIGAYQLLF